MRRHVAGATNRRKWFAVLGITLGLVGAGAFGTAAAPGSTPSTRDKAPGGISILRTGTIFRSLDCGRGEGSRNRSTWEAVGKAGGARLYVRLLPKRLTQLAPPFGAHQVNYGKSEPAEVTVELGGRTYSNTKVPPAVKSRLTLAGGVTLKRTAPPDRTARYGVRVYVGVAVMYSCNCNKPQVISIVGSAPCENYA